MGESKMTQAQRRIFLIQELLKEQPQYAGAKLPTDESNQKQLLRSLFNIRMPKPVGKDFLDVQDAYLQAEIAEKGITDLRDLTPAEDGIYLWRGDITTLRCDAIVNAANSRMLGCFVPCHGCIDNAIHTFAGIQLRLACNELMQKQGHEEETGKAKITPAFNLPSRYILHTVGPIVRGKLTARERAQLADCYRSCLNLAEKNHLESIAFCCISTGEFGFPHDRAAQIAAQTVREYRAQTKTQMEVIFNVFKESDQSLYQGLLGAD